MRDFEEIFVDWIGCINATINHGWKRKKRRETEYTQGLYIRARRCRRLWKSGRILETVPRGLRGSGTAFPGHWRSSRGAFPPWWGNPPSTSHTWRKSCRSGSLVISFTLVEISPRPTFFPSTFFRSSSISFHPFRRDILSGGKIGDEKKIRDICSANLWSFRDETKSHVIYDTIPKNIRIPIMQTHSIFHA